MATIKEAGFPGDYCIKTDDLEGMRPFDDTRPGHVVVALEFNDGEGRHHLVIDLSLVFFVWMNATWERAATIPDAFAAA